MRFLLAAILLVQAAPAQSEADKLEAALKRMGECTYRMVQGGEVIGTMTLKTRFEKVGDRKVAIFEDHATVKFGDKDFGMSLTERASLDGLRLISSIRTGNRPDGKFEWGITVKDGKVTTTVEDRTETFDVTKATTGEQAAMRLVCLAEQKVGASFKADVVTLVAERLDPDHAFRCVAQETVDIDGQKVESFKWEQKGEWNITRKIGGREVPATASINNAYWVAPEGHLVRFSQGGMDFTLVSK
jgi:hypothetical protein